jgi:hypothetical protein
MVRPLNFEKCESMTAFSELVKKAEVKRTWLGRKVLLSNGQKVKISAVYKKFDELVKSKKTTPEQIINSEVTAKKLVDLRHKKSLGGILNIFHSFKKILANFFAVHKEALDKAGTSTNDPTKLKPVPGKTQNGVLPPPPNDKEHTVLPKNDVLPPADTLPPPPLVNPPAPDTAKPVQKPEVKVDENIKAQETKKKEETPVLPTLDTVPPLPNDIKLPPVPSVKATDAKKDSVDEARTALDNLDAIIALAKKDNNAESATKADDLNWVTNPIAGK